MGETREERACLWKCEFSGTDTFAASGKCPIDRQEWGLAGEGAWSQRELGLQHCFASVEIHESGHVTKLELVGSQFTLL